MPIQYMDNGFGPHVDRGLQAATARLEPSLLNVDSGGDRGQHSRDMIEHILALESERVPAVTPAPRGRGTGMVTLEVRLDAGTARDRGDDARCDLPELDVSGV